MLIVCEGFMPFESQAGLMAWVRESIALTFDSAVSVLTLKQLQCRAFVHQLGCPVILG